MENIELTQMVKLDHNSEKMVEQTVNYDPKDEWIYLTHDGNEISLSLENWRKIRELVEKVISK